MIDVLEYLGEDEQTKAIILYIEGIRDGRRFIETAQKITPKKPVLAQYVGGSAAGARAGLSHTGALAGPDFLYEGIFKQAGIIRCHSIEDLYAHGWMHAAQPPLRGRRLAIVTNSGGPGTAISHNADQGGMTVPRFSDALQAKIRPLIAPHASSANPVDLTFHLDTKLLAATIPAMILESGEVDAIAVHGAMNSGFMKAVYPHMREIMGDISLESFLDQTAKDMTAAVELPRKYGLPLVVSSFFGREDNNTSLYMDHDVPVFDSPEKAARGMVSLLRHLEIRGRKPIVTPALPPENPEAAGMIRTALAAGQKALDEHQAKEILAAYGVPITREGIAANEDEAVKIAGGIGFPVAVKACAWEIMHKSGRGLIALNIRTEEALRDAFRSIRAAAGREVPILDPGDGCGQPRIRRRDDPLPRLRPLRAVRPGRRLHGGAEGYGLPLRAARVPPRRRRCSPTSGQRRFSAQFRGLPAVDAARPRRDPPDGGRDRPPPSRNRRDRPEPADHRGIEARRRRRPLRPESVATESVRRSAGDMRDPLPQGVPRPEGIGVKCRGHVPEARRDRNVSPEHDSNPCVWELDMRPIIRTREEAFAAYIQ